MRPNSLSRRIAALAVLPVVLLMSACSMKYDVTIHENDTADVSVLMWGDDVAEEDCGILDLTDDTKVNFTEYDGQPACESVTKDLPLSEVTSEDFPLVITHEDGLYLVDYEVGDPSDLELYTASTLTVTFPAAVTEASGNADISGNSVTWNLLEESGTLHAEAKESAGLPLLGIFGGILGVLVVAGIVVAIVLVTRKKKAGASAYPAQGYAQPGQMPQGYTQPGQAPQGYGQPAPQQPQAPQGYGQSPEPGVPSGQ